MPLCAVCGVYTRIWRGRVGFSVVVCPVVGSCEFCSISFVWFFYRFRILFFSLFFLSFDCSWGGGGDRTKDIDIVGQRP